MRKLHWTPEAVHDREAVYDHIEADNPVAALALDALFAEKAGYLVEHPGPADLVVLPVLVSW